MPPSIALFLWLILLFWLLRYDPAKESRTSLALWVPLIWMFIIESRLPSQWLGNSSMESAAQAFEEGNSLDRTIYLGLILLSVAILTSRSINWTGLFARNLALTAFLSFALVSIAWSDFPFVAFKRWFRDLGNYLVIVVVLSDPCPHEAVRGFLRRLYYLLIPLSILLIKYYPYQAIHYSFWTGLPEYTGAATSKNTLGAMCMISGIFFFWDTVRRWPDRKQQHTKRVLIVNLAFIGMTVWLLMISDSATSRVCLIIGCIVIALSKSRWSKHHPGFLKVLIPAFFCLYLILAFGLDLNGDLASKVGRDPTFTGRTNIWKAVLSTNTNPLIGTGYESFWLGPRLQQVWRLAGGVNEAHNGYLEVYLDLGIIGFFLVAGLLIASYKSIWRKLMQSPSLASLALPLWIIALFYNMTEAAFTAPFMCLTFLLGTIDVPRKAAVRGVPAEEPSLRGFHNAEPQQN